MKRWILVLAIGVGLALAARTAQAGTPVQLAHDSVGSTQAMLVNHGHHGGWHHGHGHHGHHGGYYGRGAYYRPRYYGAYYAPYTAFYPAPAYPVYPYSYSGVTVFGPRFGVSVGF